jgi:hypothetical protein
LRANFKEIKVKLLFHAYDDRPIKGREGQSRGLEGVSLTTIPKKNNYLI